MNPISFVPIIIAEISLAYANFIKNKDWILVSFVI